MPIRFSQTAAPSRSIVTTVTSISARLNGNQITPSATHPSSSAATQLSPTT
jgi:hypothetical protein